MEKILVASTSNIIFEFPLTAQIRTLLRMESLYNRLDELLKRDDITSHQFALYTIFEIIENGSQPGIRLDLLHEIEKQKQSILASDFDTKENLIEMLNENIASLQKIKKKFGQEIRENEWLMSIKHRMQNLAGSNLFDSHSFLFWLNLSASQRHELLQEWIGPLQPTKEAIKSLLYILRNMASKKECLAKDGCYQENELGSQIQMIAIECDKSEMVVPEVSANRYLVSVRFVEVSFQNIRGSLIKNNIPFSIYICNFYS